MSKLVEEQKKKLRVYFDKSSYKFYEVDTKEELETIYNKSEKIEIENAIYIKKEEIYYICPNARYITFIFPSGLKQSIFISDAAQISKIRELYPDTKFFMKLEGKDSFVEMKDLVNRKYLEIKIEGIFQNDNEYKEANNIIIQSKLTLKNLSIVSKDYLYIPESLEDIKFDLTNERKEFFQYLKNEINNNNFIPICGPESIGKTSTILGYFSLNRDKYEYLYTNLKTLDKYKGDEIKIQELIVKELFHCLRLEDINSKLDELKKVIADESNNPIKLISLLIEKLDFYGIYLIIDQYKITFDKDYNELQIIQRKANKRFINIILISSMNEEDVKDSIVSTISNPTRKDIFKLDYIYVNSLIKCNNDNDLKNESDKLLLKNYGSTYYYYYNILEERKEFTGKYEDFEDYFDNKMLKYFEDRLRTYHNNINDEILINYLLFLLRESDDYIPVQRFIENEKFIPFRFFNFYYDNKNIFKIKDINQKDNIKIKFQCNKYIKFALLIYQKLLNKIEDKIILEKHYDLEQLFFIILWSSRKNPVIKDINIVKIAKTKSLFKIEDNLDVNNLNANEAILILLTDKNAISFDTAILKKEKDGTFSIYLFQITKKKNSNERLTYLMLNDYFNFFKIHLKEKLNINISNYYFSYVFDKSERDKATEDFLMKYDINFILLDKINLLNSINLKPYKTKLQTISNLWQYKDENNFYIYINKDTSGKSDTCYDYLLKKRKVVQNISSIENIHSKENLKNLIMSNDKDESKQKKEAEKKKTKKEERANKSKKAESRTKSKPQEIGISLEENNSQNESINTKKELKEKKEKTIKILNPIKEPNYEEIAKKIKEGKDYYRKVKDAYNKWNTKSTKFEMTNIQKEKILTDYFIEVNDNIAGISYEIKDQFDYIKNFIKYENQVDSLHKFLDYIGKGEFDFIISCEKINLSSMDIVSLCPEYNSYIINIINVNNKTELYYFDYIKRKRINLEDLSESDFSSSGTFYIISFARRTKTNYELKEFNSKMLIKDNIIK